MKATTLLAPALLTLCLAFGTPASAQQQPVPLAMGQTFTMASAALGETRRINVYLPAAYTDSAGTARLPVLYMPDGGMAEDFLHVAGLIEVLVGDNTMRPFLLVGIETTERRRDMTGPTEKPEDRKIAPHVGGSAALRKFMLRHFVMDGAGVDGRLADAEALVACNGRAPVGVRH